MLSEMGDERPFPSYFDVDPWPWSKVFEEAAFDELADAILPNLQARLAVCGCNRRRVGLSCCIKVCGTHYDWLVVWNIVYFPFHIWDVILPIDKLIFFKMVIAPPTRWSLELTVLNPWVNYGKILRDSKAASIQMPKCPYHSFASATDEDIGFYVVICFIIPTLAVHNHFIHWIINGYSKFHQKSYDIFMKSPY